ncbi:hypothetical protein KSP40_PGU021216 [Platanthera guangdongensis]|uniref:Uncharacterized protein n=1 Tax=Platanthera guangdongensis TaxID=2320717 RepID=A0ABR2LYJ9_9ASPA
MDKVSSGCRVVGRDSTNREGVTMERVMRLTVSCVGDDEQCSLLLEDSEESSYRGGLPSGCFHQPLYLEGNRKRKRETGDFSSHCREIDVREETTQQAVARVKLKRSYGGPIHLCTHDYQLAYFGGRRTNSPSNYPSASRRLAKLLTLQGATSPGMMRVK